MKIANKSSEILNNTYSQNQSNFKLENKKNNVSFDKFIDNSPKDKLDLKSKPNTNSTNLVSSKEREFFKSLFPDRDEVIDKYVLFNKNGKVDSQYQSKGLIVDGRI